MNFRIASLLTLVTALLFSAELQARDPACPFVEASPPLLNSERIERCFGSYGVQVIDPVDHLRVARLYSLESGARVCRTLALTAFVVDLPPTLDPAMEKIRAGSSIGATLKSMGWTVGKQTIEVTRVKAGNRFRELSGLITLPQGTIIATHLYRLVAGRAGESHVVARIAEMHHPDYMTLADLERIRGSADQLGAPGPEDKAFELRILNTIEEP